MWGCAVEHVWGWEAVGDEVEIRGGLLGRVRLGTLFSAELADGAQKEMARRGVDDDAIVAGGSPGEEEHVEPAVGRYDGDNTEDVGNLLPIFDGKGKSTPDVVTTSGARLIK